MSFLEKGPELKPSEIKVPDFLQDLYYDLKDRHLLPLAAILLVAIVAAPFVLGDSSDSPATTPPPVQSVTGAEGATASASGQLVAKSAPGLRDYRRRLDHLKSKNPFRQQYQNKASSSEGGESATSSEGSTATEPSTGGGTEQTESPANTTVPGELTYFSYAIDVRVTTGIGGGEEDQASSGQGKTTVRHNLPQVTSLPSRATPAIIYMGATKDGKKALMLVSSDVQAIFGDAKCALGSETCQLLAMEPGLPETFVYGKTGKTFKIELLKIHLVESKHLNRAPLGKSHANGDKPQPHGERLTIVGAAAQR